MTYGYSVDLRKKALIFIKKGGRITAATQVFNVSRSTLHNWIRQERKTGSLDIKPRVKKRWKYDPEALKNFVERHNDMHLEEIGQHFNMTASGICRALKRWQITRKKTS